MNLVQYAEAILTNAQRYRNGELLTTVLPKLRGQQLSPDVVRELLEPYMKQLRQDLSARYYTSLLGRLDEYVPVAMERVAQHRHRNTMDGTGMVTQKNCDAVLIEFVNEACVETDLEFNANDLEPYVAPDSKLRAPAGMSRVVGVNLHTREDYVVKDCNSPIEACEITDAHNRARVGNMADVYYAYNDRGDYIRGNEAIQIVHTP